MDSRPTRFMESDVLSLVNELKKKIVIATAIVMVKWARREGISPIEFTRNFQEKYIRENQEIIDPILEQKYLNHCQDEVLEKLRKAIPAPDLKTKDSVFVGGGCLDWFEELSNDTKVRCVVKTEPSSPANATPKREYCSEDHALRNIEFVESILRLSEESKRNSLIPTSLLQSLLYDESTSQPLAQGVLTNNFSDDSGIGMSEKSTEDSEEVKYVSSGVVRFALHSSKTNELVVQSNKFIVNHLKKELMANTKEVFFNWKGSLPEYACEILSDCARINKDCMEMVQVFIIDVLDDVWNDTMLSQHQKWEMKIRIVSELMANNEICLKTLQYISDRLDEVSKCLRKKNSHIILLTEKLSLFLNLYCDVCATVKEFKIKAKDVDETIDSEDIEVTRLWQERWCAKDNDEDSQHLINKEGGMNSHIKILEHFIVSIFYRYPIISTLAVEALNKAVELNKQDESR